MHHIICLANSRKLSGHCVAGRTWSSSGAGEWIRPVSNRPKEELSAEERCYQDGAEPAVLDVMDVALLERRPHGHQHENWVVDPLVAWRKLGSLRTDRKVLDPILSPIQSLWSDHQKRSDEKNDRVSEEEARNLGDSLRFIAVDRAALKYEDRQGPLKPRLVFNYSGDDYNLSVTDPKYAVPSSGVVPESMELGYSYLTVSLGELWHGDCYKLVASILEVP